MRIAKGVEMFVIEVAANLTGKASTINPTLLWDDGHVVLVDTGYPGLFPRIREAAVKTGAPLEKLDKVIVTHQDIDHIGGLVAIRKELRQTVEFLAYETEKPYIQGDECPVKLAQMEAQRDVLPEAMQVFYEKMKAGFAISRVAIDRTLRDDEVLPYCGGIRVIHTPGHTPGHICLYHQESKTLIAGDALMVENGRLIHPPELIMADVALNRKSLQKLTQYDFEAVICYHGGLCRDDPKRQLTELLG